MHDIAGRCSLGRYVQSVCDGSPLDGAEKELQQAFGLSGNKMPVIMMARADALSAPPAGAEVVAQGIIAGRVWPTSILDRLARITVHGMGGEIVHSVMTAGANPAIRIKGAQGDAPAATWNIKQPSPKRVDAVLIFDSTDLARVPTLEAQLSEDLAGALRSLMDQYGIQGVVGLTSPNGIMGSASVTRRFAAAGARRGGADQCRGAGGRGGAGRCGR